MKLPLVILTFLFFLAFTGTAQQISITIEKSEDLNSFAASIRNIETFFDEDPQPIQIRLFECGRTVGFLPQGLDVILYDFYISVRQATEEYPIGEYGYFWVIGHFIDPRNYIFDPLKGTLTFNHGTKESIEKTTLKISFETINVQ
jgi:hypothetical protein